MVRTLRRSLARAFAFFVCLLGALSLAQPARADGPLAASAVPEPLKPWVAWAMDGAERCPVLYDHADQTRCAWPSTLALGLDDHGASFTQTWRVDAASTVALPGNAKRWPLDVTVDGKPGLVVTRAGQPSVSLPVGEHRLEGRFAWDTLPESLAIPKETGLLDVTLRGAKVASPNRDADGTVWFQKTPVTEEGDALTLLVQREVTDDIPLRLLTRIELHVSGKSREELLGKALPLSFVPMSLESPLPARVEPDGRIRVQVRPGVFTLELLSRGEGQVTSLTRPLPEGPWKEGSEVWVFQAKNDYRIVTVEGVPPIDPQQTTLPEAWKKLPAYEVAVGATMRFVETRRGDEGPPPDQLELARSLWLDFDGEGFTAQDVITGSLNRESRLTLAPPTTLGRVAIDGRDQFITASEGVPGTGVEVRSATLRVTADSRIEGRPRDIPAVGWAHDFHQVSASLHLPPGWTLFYATGVDDVPGTWVRHWSLLELFLALMIGIVVGRLYGLGWGAVALVMLTLTLPEVDAPEWCWVPLLALEAIVRLLPAGRVRKVSEGARLAAFLFVAIAVLPFVVRQVRQGLHPALVQPGLVVGEGGESRAEQDGGAEGFRNAEKGVAEPAPAGAAAAPGAMPPGALQDIPLNRLAEEGLDMKAGGHGGGAPARAAKVPLGSIAVSSAGRAGWSSANPQAYDPAAVVQTGPGLPRWQWSTLTLRWTGPVTQGQRVHLYLISPLANLALALLRAALLLVVAFRLFPYSGRIVPRFFGPRRGAVALAALAIFSAVALASPVAHAADVPDKATLDDLRARIVRPAPCSPTCASSDRLAVQVQNDALRLRLEVDVAATTAVPLPGTEAQWTPSNVHVDGHAPSALARIDNVLWVSLDAGRHQVVLEGPMPDRGAMQLTLPFKSHRVEVQATGWSVTGVHEDGLADDDLEFARLESVKRDRRDKGRPEATLEPGVLPPFVSVARTLHIGLEWELDTEVTRVTPVGSAVVLDVPLLEGERVTSADVRVSAGKAHVFLGPDATSVSWHSVLAEKSPIVLVAPRDVAWAEVWRLDLGPIWHATYSGIPFVHVDPVPGAKVAEWRPWPGESATITLTRPEGVPGQTLTLDESTTALSPGLRATDVTLSLTIRSSRGGNHTVTLPDEAELEALSINGTSAPVRQDGRSVRLPIVPGAQHVQLTFRVPTGIGLLFTSPVVDLGAPSVNATVALDVPGGRWVLFTMGPRVGPAILFWSLLVVLLVVAFALGRNRWTPLRTWHWALLFIGLSQVDLIAGMFFVGWLLALGYRARDEGEGPPSQWFNLRQVVLVAWTVAALVVLAVSLRQGLLGTPEMQIEGNGSSSTLLRWFTDRTASRLPEVRIVSVPLLVYRGAMLAWALWVVLSLLAWLRWGWAAFTRGGGWKKGPPRAPRPPRNYASPPYHPPAGAAPSTDVAESAAAPITNEREPDPLPESDPSTST